MTTPLPSLAQKEKPDSAYFLKLATALIILAAVWFGSNFFKNKNEPALSNNILPGPKLSQQSVLAASLPLVQDAFLVSRSDIIKPIRKWNVDMPNLSAQSIFAVETSSGKILFQKEPEKTRPIASLTKLTTALVVMEKVNLKDEILISQNAVDTEGEMSGLVVDEKLAVGSLLYILLMESSNDAAVALAEKFSNENPDQFVDLMNQKVQTLNLTDTHFSDPSGLDIKNVSTAKEIAEIIKQVIKIPFLNLVTITQNKEIFSLDGKIRHPLLNTNKLLAKYPEIIAGKTGYIDEAGGCMALAIKSPDGQGTIINVVLGSQDRMGDMDKLIQWEKEGFLW